MRSPPGPLSVPGAAHRGAGQSWEGLFPDATEDEELLCSAEGAEQDFLLLAVLLQMCMARFANGLASCNYPVSPGEEGTALQPNLISLNLLQNCPRLLGIVYILLVLLWPLQAGGSADTLQPVPPFCKAPLSSSTLTGVSLQEALLHPTWALQKRGVWQGRRGCRSYLQASGGGGGNVWHELLPLPAALGSGAKGRGNRRGSAWGWKSACAVLQRPQRAGSGCSLGQVRR